MKLLAQNSTGSDIFNISMLSECQYILIPSLCYIYNLSISLGVFPSALKVVKTIKIFKKGDHASLRNYRPISLLCIFSKILESLMATRLVPFLKNIIYFM